jgi:uncharacterized protein YjlB
MGEVYLGSAYYNDSKGGKVTRGRLLNYTDKDNWGTKKGTVYYRNDGYTRYWRKVWMSDVYRFAVYNRYKYGKKYRTGSVYNVRVGTAIKQTKGTKKTINLKPGDRVTMLSNHGFTQSYKSNWFRINGYYRKGSGKHHETFGGYVYIPQTLKSPGSYSINTY